MSERAAITRNLKTVRQRIQRAAERAGKDPAAITLVAVTKSVGLDAINVLRDLGVTHFGENRVEVARAKIEALQDDSLTWHMIGNIQRRKIRDVIALFDRIDAVDRLVLAEALQARGEQAGAHVNVLVEVNVSGETKKHGFAPAELDDALAAMAGMDRLHVRGLMTMAPFGAPEDRIREVFRALAALAAERALPDVSMGMSQDYDLAVEEGATEVRVGSALFEQ